jgi:hypothetical protein
MEWRESVKVYSSPESQRRMTATMRLMPRPDKDIYSETEASEFLGLSVDRLHLLLSENVFNDGSPWPPSLSFRPSDLILLEFWNKSMGDKKVVRMPKR